MKRISWPTLVAACVVAALVRIAWISLVHAVPVSDFGFYYGKAVSLAAGAGYTNSGVPTAFWPPGYPFFLSLFFYVTGPSVLVSKLVSIGLWVVTTALAYLLGLRLGGRAHGRTVAAAAAFLVALFPEFVFYANLAASENLFIPLVLGACLALSPPDAEETAGDDVVSADATGGNSRAPSWARAAIAGLLIGFAILVRTTATALPLLMLLVLVIRYRSKASLVAALSFTIAVAVALSPWLIRNTVVMGAPVLSTNGGISLWGASGPLASGGYQPKEPLPRVDRSSPAQEMASNDYYSKEAMDYILTDPIRWLSLAPAKARFLFGKPATLSWQQLEPTKDGQAKRPMTAAEKRAIAVAVALRLQTAWPMRLLWLVGLIGAGLAVWRLNPAGIWLATVIGYWLVFHLTLGNGQPRYLMSVAPAVAITAAYAAVMAYQRVRGARAASAAGSS